MKLRYLMVVFVIAAAAVLGYLTQKNLRSLHIESIRGVAGINAVPIEPEHASKGLSSLWWNGNDQEENDKDYDLSSLMILSRVLSYINNYYYEPDRIEPHDMLCAALERMQRMVAELLIKFNADKSKVEVTVNNKTKSFDISNVKRLFDIQYALSGIMEFIQENLTDPEIKKPDIEYAAINGMLDELDPHSSLLPPKAYGEFKLSTRGHFGGLGILIGIRDGNLTIISPYEGTPAWKAGLKAGDHIVEINGQSTVNMSLEEAVKLMRGAPGTKCTIKILRKGWKKPRAFTLIRDTIRIRSVKSRLYANSVGYIKINAFQGNTAREVRNHLQRLKQRAGKKFAGLIIDLRDNPGGLLEQAINVSDIFIKSGVIVSTVGASRASKEVEKAHAYNTEPYNYPIVVLVDGNSASAAEIVSGALKNNDRAIVVGDRTFGKGSVQMLYEFDDGSALKLTIAQYLTPGDISIQNVGIMPDVRLLPALISEKEIVYYTAGDIRREKDLEKTLKNIKKSKAQMIKPEYTLKFLFDEKRDKEDEQKKGRYDYIQHDFYIQFGEKLVKELKGIADRKKAIAKMAGFIKQVEQEEDTKLEKALAKLGVDWSVGKFVAGGQVKARVKFGKDNKLTAGDKATITVEAKNTGSAPIYRLHLISHSDYGLLDKLEFLLGKIEPGESKTFHLPLEVPKDALNQTDMVSFDVADGFDNKFPKFEELVHISELPPPKFAYSYSIDDSEGGNGDGWIQPGEEISLVLNIDNVGDGKAYKGLVTLRTHELIPEVFISSGRVLFGELEAGKSKAVICKFRVKNEIRRHWDKVKDGLLFDVNIMDTELNEYISDQINLTISKQFRRSAKLKKQHAILQPNTRIYSMPDDKSNAIATVKKQVKLDAASKMGNWILVRWNDGLSGWVKDAVLKPGEISKKHRKRKKDSQLEAIEPLFFRRAPRIAVDLSTVEPYTTASAVTIRGQAVDDNFVKDIYILANRQKAFFKANTAKPNTDAGRTMQFEATVPLEEGINRIIIVARETRKFSGSEIIIIFREKDESDSEDGAGKK